VIRPPLPDLSAERERRAPQGPRLQLGRVVTLAAAHCVHDVYTAFLAPWLPLLIARLQLSLLQAGSLTLFLQLPSLVNPWLGALADRRGYTRAMVILSPAATGAAMSLLGLAPSFGALAILLLVAGVSVAALHVAAPVAMAEAAGERTGLGMSFHMLGGELARTIGPLLAVQVVSWWGLQGAWRLIPLGFAASLLLWWRLGRLPLNPQREAPTGLVAVLVRLRRVFLAVLGIMGPRAFLAAAVTSFLPTLLHGEGASLWFASAALAAFEAAGAVGVFGAGAISDRLGRRPVVLAAVVLSPPLMVLFLVVHGYLQLLVLLALGLVMLATTPVLMAAVIENAGADRAAANGVYMMINFTVRSLVVPVVGAMGDALGLREAYWICTGIAVLGIPFALLLPKGRRAA